MFDMNSIILSWTTDKCINDTASLLNWIKERNEQIDVDIQKITLSKCKPWFYDETEGCIKNKEGSFFTVCGIESKTNSNIYVQQPIIIQDEIGYLGILIKEIEGVAYFLMQAKIEPGNLNKVQISPTIQATRSNFAQKHGGKKPHFLDYFMEAKPENIVVDQIQSEQSSRFLGKRNRNIVVITDDDIDEGKNFRWMTLNQIKQLMRYDNLVNMDTRTVIACLPFWQYPDSINKLKKKNETASIKSITKIYNYLNNYKMHTDIHKKLIPMRELSGWSYNSIGEFVYFDGFPFKMIFCDISIEGREVKHWRQPCFEAEGIGVFGLIYKKVDGLTQFLVKAKSEIGCFDKIELGPSVQVEYASVATNDSVNTIFFNRYHSRVGVKLDVLLSEEGGRFYHEQNRNIVLEIEENQLREIPDGYFWCSFTTLNTLCQVNNILNIQLRNLLSLLDGDFL